MSTNLPEEEIIADEKGDLGTNEIEVALETGNESEKIQGETVDGMGKGNCIILTNKVWLRETRIYRWEAL